jgi:GntR family transcriptional regulator, rspAB operon transcriptional repressor
MPYPPLPNDVNISLTERVYQALKTGILAFQIKPRDHLIIGTVANHYGISRTPVREALILLQNEGWVNLNGVRGAMVVVPSTKTIKDVIQVKMVLEGFVIREAVKIITEEQLQEIKSVLDASECALAEGDLEKSEHLGSQFHTLMGAVLDNPVLKATIKHLQDQVDRVRPLIWTWGKEMLEQSALQHRAMLKAIEARDAVKAEQLIFEHTIWFESKLIPSLGPMLD